MARQVFREINVVTNPLAGSLFEAGAQLGYLPYLLFLACPLMYLFMHHGPGHGDRGHGLLQNGRNDPPAGRNPGLGLPR